MSPEIVTLLGALGGGAVGVFGALGAARIAGREQGRNQQEQWRRQVRRDAYAAFITRANEALHLAGELHEYEGEAAGAERRLEDLNQCLARLHESATLVYLEGPAGVAGDAMEITSHVGCWVGALQGMHSPGLEGYGPALDRAGEHSYKAQEGLEQLLLACRTLLDE